MLKTVKARFHRGHIEPLEPLKLQEGAEVVVTITHGQESATPEDYATQATAGGWKDLLDCEQFEKQVYQSRMIQTRPKVRL